MSNPVARMRTGTVTIDEASNALANALNDWFVGYGPSVVYKNCDNCRHMTEDGPAFCSKYGATPPASVIVVGCPDHDDKEDIPF